MKNQNEKIRQIRKSRKLTLQKLSALTGIDTSRLSKFERGLVDITVSQLRAIAKALGISVGEFFDEN